MAAFAQVDAGELRVGFLIIGYRRDIARIQGVNRYNVLKARTHRVSRKPFNVAYYYVLYVTFKGILQSEYFCAGTAAAGGSISFV